MTEGGTNNGPDTEVSSEEDDTTAAEVVVDGVREPATDETKRQLVKSVSVMNKRRLYVRAANVRSGVDETDENSVASDALVTNAIHIGPEDGSTVATSLIPALNGGTNGACCDGDEESCGHVPLVCHFTLQNVQFM